MSNQRYKKVKNTDYIGTNKLENNSKLTYKQVHDTVAKAAKRLGPFVGTGFFLFFNFFNQFY